ncbi:hypothetical protein CLAVI_000488 [Candidatus Clavichlamydia salmonicola]|uniref:hypothetical protein n=1 Tax=Candidatus Clavichlamydia salmonicola TaxID=469812 RepID=UPI001890E1DC|nr:hypothetical protein [Candidatus Clavichlamydia salmonicola]MBF5050866.1 hypothetical protein [Candidatus Clavichlamydia salmonicola]
MSFPFLFYSNNNHSFCVEMNPFYWLPILVGNRLFHYQPNQEIFLMGMEDFFARMQYAIINRCLCINHGLPLPRIVTTNSSIMYRQIIDYVNQLLRTMIPQFNDFGSEQDRVLQNCTISTIQLLNHIQHLDRIRRNQAAHPVENNNFPIDLSISSRPLLNHQHTRRASSSSEEINVGSFTQSLTQIEHNYSLAAPLTTTSPTIIQQHVRRASSSSDEIDVCSLTPPLMKEENF